MGVSPEQTGLTSASVAQKGIYHTQIRPYQVWLSVSISSKEEAAEIQAILNFYNKWKFKTFLYS